MGVLRKIFGFPIACLRCFAVEDTKEELERHPKQACFEHDIRASSIVEEDAGREQMPLQNHPHDKLNKQQSLSTLSAWQILSSDIQAAVDDVAVAPPSSLHAAAPPLPFQGWSCGTLESTFELLDELGRGAFGRVYKARRLKDAAPACVKIISSVGSSASKEMEMVSC